MDKKELQQLLSTAGTELKGEIEGAQANLKEARSLTAKIQRLYDKSTALVAEFEDVENGFPSKLTAATNASSQIAEIADSAKTNLTNIEAGLTAVEQNISNMQTAYAEFQVIKAQIDDPTTGLEAIFESAQKTQLDIDALQKESETLNAGISRFRDTAAKNVNSIEAIKTSSEEALASIKKHETDSESTKNKIASIFSLVSRSGHANYFDTRRKSLVHASWAWLAGSVVFAIVAVILARKLIVPLVVPNESHTVDNLLELLIARVSVITPFLILSIFAASNYTKERRLSEHYAFRAVSALTIESSVQLLERSLSGMDCNDKDQSIVEFAVGTMKNIYSEPQELVKTVRFSLRGGTKLADVGAELNETLNTVSKDLATIVEQTKTDTEQ